MNQIISEILRSLGRGAEENAAVVKKSRETQPFSLSDLVKGLFTTIIGRSDAADPRPFKTQLPLSLRTSRKREVTLPASGRGQSVCLSHQKERERKE